MLSARAPGRGAWEGGLILLHVDAAFIAGLPHAGHSAVTDAEAKGNGLCSQGAPALPEGAGGGPSLLTIPRLHVVEPEGPGLLADFFLGSSLF